MHHKPIRNAVQVLTYLQEVSVDVRLHDYNTASNLLTCRKYEEIYAPQVEEFCYITDNTYNRAEVRSVFSRMCRDACQERLSLI